MHTLTALTPDELLVKLGEAIKRLRLDKNIAQLELARQAGISRASLVNLETGAGATITTLIRVLKALGREDWLDTLAPRVTVRPMEMFRLRHARQRASARSDPKG